MALEGEVLAVLDWPLSECQKARQIAPALRRRFDRRQPEELTRVQLDELW